MLRYRRIGRWPRARPDLRRERPPTRRHRHVGDVADERTARQPGALGPGHPARPGTRPGGAVRPVVGRGEGREVGPCRCPVPHRDGFAESEDDPGHHTQHGDGPHAPHRRGTTVTVTRPATTPPERVGTAAGPATTPPGRVSTAAGPATIPPDDLAIAAGRGRPSNPPSARRLSGSASPPGGPRPPFVPSPAGRPLLHSSLRDPARGPAPPSRRPVLLTPQTRPHVPSPPPPPRPPRPPRGGRRAARATAVAEPPRPPGRAPTPG